MTYPAFNFQDHKFFPQTALIVPIEDTGDGVGGDELIEKGGIQIFPGFRGNVGMGAVKEHICRTAAF